IPDHPRIRHLGFIDDTTKFDALAAAEALVMPSFYESLSMVALEAWAMGRPVLANARCDVLHGQCLRSNAGLFYTDYPEFAETLHALVTNGALNAALGRNGRSFFRANYAWPVIDAKYDAMLEHLQQADAGGRPSRMEPLPGWLARQRGTLPPAREVLANLPDGPVREAADVPATGASSARERARSRQRRPRGRRPAPTGR